MAIETEIKIRLSDPAAFLRKISAMEHSELSDRHFEDNYLLDFSDGRMYARMSLVRVRLTGKKSWITYKGPPRAGGIFKTREELEVAVEDGTIALHIMENLGMQVTFRYQKYRQEYALAVPDRQGESVHVALDETPVGCFAEFEGSEEGIRAVAAAAGFDESMFLRSSYYSIYVQSCIERGETPSHMLFPEEQPAKNLPI